MEPVSGSRVTQFAAVKYGAGFSVDPPLPRALRLCLFASLLHLAGRRAGLAEGALATWLVAGAEPDCRCLGLLDL